MTENEIISKEAIENFVQNLAIALIYFQFLVINFFYG